MPLLITASEFQTTINEDYHAIFVQSLASCPSWILHYEIFSSTVLNLGSHFLGREGKTNISPGNFPYIKNSVTIGAHLASTTKWQEIGNAMPGFCAIVAFMQCNLMTSLPFFICSPCISPQKQ